MSNMDSETASREPAENENSDTISSTILNSIKMEHGKSVWVERQVNKKAAKMKVENEPSVNMDSEEVQATGTIEQLFIKNENHESTEAVPEIVLNSIKSEPNEFDWGECDADNQNNVSKMDMDNEVKEELIIKNEHNENIDAITGTVLRRIKEECSDTDNLYEFAANEDLSVQLSDVKQETDMDSEEFKVAEITEEFTIKSDSESNTGVASDVTTNSMAKNMILRKEHQVVYKKAGRKSFRCYNCNYNTDSKRNLIRHLRVHYNRNCVNSTRPGFELHTCMHCYVTFPNRVALGAHMKVEHSHDLTYKLSRCIHCNATFKSKVSLDDHVVRKHPNFISSITNKVHECTKCTYKTTKKRTFLQHVQKHAKIVWNDHSSTCIHCSLTFKNEVTLDNHIVEQHTEFITSVTRKIYECTKCIYNTTYKSDFDKHMSLHAGTDLIDEHSTNLATSIATKLYACTECSYIASVKTDFDRHMAMHRKTFASPKLRPCMYCNTTFKHKVSLDDHMLKKHPDFIASVTSKLHECTKCIFKTTKKQSFHSHMLLHTEAHAKCKTGMCKNVPNYTHKGCNHCVATFKSKVQLDDHVVKKHPNFIASITRKIYECDKCTYKSVKKNHFYRHMPTHK